MLSLHKKLRVHSSPSLLLRIGALLIMLNALGPQTLAKGSDLESQIVQELKQVENPEDVERSAANLRRLGDDAYPLLFEALALGSSEVLKGGPPVTANRVACLRKTLCSRGRNSLLAWIRDSSLPWTGSSRRTAALSLVGQVGHSEDVSMLFRLADAADENLAGRGRVLASFQRALVDVIRRSDGPDPRWVQTIKNSEPAIKRAAIRALGQFADPITFAILAQLLSGPSEQLELLLSRMALVARGMRGRPDELSLKRVRALLEVEQGRVLEYALHVVGLVEDWQCAFACVNALTSEDLPTQQAGHEALVRITGVDLGVDTRTWTDWLRNEESWYASRSPELLSHLRGVPEAVIRESARELCRHRMFRHELSPEVEVLLESPNPALRIVGCQVLQQLGSLEIPAKLVDCLDDPERSVSTVAHAALCKLSGLDLPPRSTAWREALSY